MERRVGLRFGLVLLITLGAGLVWLSATGGLPRAEAAPAALVDVWVVSPMEKVFTDTSPPEEKQLSVSLKAARGEYECFQIALRPARAGGSLSVERVTFSDLVSGEGKIPAQNMNARWVAYVNVSRPSHAEKITGMFPDPLMPFEPRQVKDTRALWITVKVPKDAQAGDYNCSIKIVAGEGKVLAEIPVSLKVWDFALPNPPTLINAWSLYSTGMRRYYGEDFSEVLKKYKENFWEHRITHLSYPATDIPSPDITVNDDGSVSIDYTKFDQAVEENIKHGLNALDVRIPGRWRKREQKVVLEYPREVVAKILADYEKHLEERGWLDMSYFFVIDEPSQRVIPILKEFHDFLKSAAPRIKRRIDFGYGATGRFAPGQEVVAKYRELVGYCEIWVPHIDCVDNEFLSERQQLGEDVWWYICCSARHPYPNFLIDYPGIDSRVPFWMLWKYGATGFAYWTVNWWMEAPFDPFKDAVRFGGANGDGLLLYPGPDGPIDSIRWELIRDGIEDYEYLAVLSSMLKEAKRKGYSDPMLGPANAALRRVSSVTMSSIEYTKDIAVLTGVRDRIGNQIEALREIMTPR